MATSLTATGVQFPDNSVTSTNPAPSGTRLFFQQSSAPTGWTKDTNTDNAMLRAISGSVTSGGSAGFTSALGSPSVSGSVSLSGAPGSGNLSTSISGNIGIGSTTLSTTQMPSHGHGLAISRISSRSNNNIENGAGNQTARPDTSSTGGSGSHNHNASHNLSGSISGAPDIGTLSGSLSSASASINVKYIDSILAQKD